jgi:hypothetical protein
LKTISPSTYVHFLALPAAWAEQAGMPKEMVLRHLCDWAIGGGFPPGAFVYPSAAPVEPFDIYMSGRAMAEDSPYGRRPGGVSVSSNHWGLALLGQVLLTGSVTGTGAEIQRPGWWASSGCSGRNLPGLGRLGSEDPKGAAGDEVALKVERVVDRSMHREKALG